MMRHLFLVAMGSVLLLASCKQATQVSFDITTDVSCENLGATVIFVGVEGTTEKSSEPATVRKVCSSKGTVNAIGTYAAYPGPEGKTATASIKVAVAVGADIDAESDCVAAKQYRGCIVARRRISFVPSRSLTVPVSMSLVCKDVACDEDSTCNRAGKCVSSKVDISQCDSNGVCGGLETKENEGLPCSTELSAATLFCTGENAWCNVPLTGQARCEPAPAEGGYSFQCRSAADCGAGLQCVAGTGSVLGKCVLASEVPPGSKVLCSVHQMPSPCPGGGRYCRGDAGAGLSSCVEPPRRPDGGVWEGLPCPRDGELRCFGETPFCSQFTETPTCVADGGAQCWYAADCAPGQSCFAGLNAPYSNVCAYNPTPQNDRPLCNPTLNSADCPPGMACDGLLYGNRVCRTPCAAGRGDCNGLLLDDCETDTTSNPTHCGACGEACNFPHAQTSCVAGACQMGACLDGYVDCNQDPQDGCEVREMDSCESTKLPNLCNVGVQACTALSYQSASCNASRGTCSRTAAASKPAGSACGTLSGATCTSTETCLCPADAGLNTPCGTDSVCGPLPSDGGVRVCTQNKIWHTQHCGIRDINTGQAMCEYLGFTRALSAWGYFHWECAGPNPSFRTYDNCRTYNADRTRCLSWRGAISCSCPLLTSAGSSALSYGEDGDGGTSYVFKFSKHYGVDLPDGGYNKCSGFSPGYSVRLHCEY